MAHIELPTVDELKRFGIVRRFLEQDFTAEYIYSLAVLATMTVLAVAFNDPMTPFYSFNFVFGVSAIFFFSITFSTGLGLVLSAGVLSLMLCVNWSAGQAPLVIFLCEGPFLALFFGGLAILPNVMPLLLAAEAASLEEQNRGLEARVLDLESQLSTVQKEARADRVDRQRTETVKLSTRTAVLHSFTRELLQSSSQREMLNVLFHNLTRVFGVQECALLIHTRGQPDLVVTRIVHPQASELENTKIDLNVPVCRMLLDRKTEIWFDTPETVDRSLTASLLVPILVDGEIYAVLCAGRTKSGDLEREEADFIIALADMTTGAIEQLKMVLAI